ncbi:tRNA-dependent cyclodipeptide synthase [Streptomyces gobiensis]|uniref:tRNA-dependent cyclodipeptide synthase n=1 Tax=Streptomyces gobiensis TaxID=2875706 RepID=UPI001E447F0A|nr:tRNA-dependent cyclodipeptide synthase [Streptomyces gobiensis]UGY91271.1 tRNA-dependent cyclodipeptide synthase [Streptomyces gobiensis]
MPHASLPAESAESAKPWHPLPLTDRCQAAFASRAHACVGISPFNSHFTAERIAVLARWALSAFTRVHFFVPDTAAAFTLEALGYAPEKAAWKARRQGQYVRNKITRALAEVGINAPDALILDGQTLSANPAYLALLKQVEQRYREDPFFARACLGASAWTLERRLPPGQAPTDEQVRVAVRYFLAELPLFLDTPRIAGVATSVFCYHQVPAFLDDLFHHRLALRPEAGQGYLHLVEGVR